MRQNNTNVSLQSFFDLSVQTLSILRDMHAADLIHCDLKPANIVVKAGKTPVIIDFGPIKNRSKIDAQSFVMHTPRFSAPEISELPAHVSQWSDIYWLFASRDFDRDQVATNGLALPKFEGLPDSFTAELQACFAKGLPPRFKDRFPGAMTPSPRCAACAPPWGQRWMPSIRGHGIIWRANNDRSALGLTMTRFCTPCSGATDPRLAKIRPANGLN